MIRIKRIYEPASNDDGVRILVDRIWPRGISRLNAKVDFWEKEAAPTTQLRRWFGHKPEHWKEFQRRYRSELKTNPALEDLRILTRQKRVTLLYAARSDEHNHAVVLLSVLGHLRRKKHKPSSSKLAKI